MSQMDDTKVKLALAIVEEVKPFLCEEDCARAMDLEAKLVGDLGIPGREGCVDYFAEELIVLYGQFATLLLGYDPRRLL